jgi:hypothetical protein
MMFQITEAGQPLRLTEQFGEHPPRIFHEGP